VSSAGAFTIQEIGRIGRKTGGRPDGGPSASFEWVSDRTPPDPAKGGARACPLAPWNMGGTMRHVRTDYSGSRTPSVQVLGPRKKAQTFRGRWDDRYNFAGYAAGEMRRFEAMCERGNLVRIQFQGQAFEGQITDWDFPYRRAWYIEYTFTFDPHVRAGEANMDDRSPTTTVSTQQAFDDLDFLVDTILDAQDYAPRTAVAGDVMDTVDASLASMSASRDAIGDTLDQRELIKEDVRPIEAFTRMATQFRQAQNDALSILDDLTAVRSDLDLAHRTAMSVLAFEDWSRSIRFRARVALGTSRAAALGVEERSDPNALALYRPHRGESLMKISRRFYGTPHCWGLIAERNALTTMALTGDELLIIPERGTG